MEDEREDMEAGRGEIILYPTKDGQSRVECRFQDDSVWLTQKLMAELFQTSVPNINQHLSAIYQEGELAPERTIKKYLIVQQEGARTVSRQVDHYNLEAIIAVGYRVRSTRGTQFRQWATSRLAEYLKKGFVLDDERLKNPPGPGVPDYFDELLERIRDIRASERRIYLKLRDILALAADYQPNDTETQTFYMTVQNKLHFAVTGKTAPELIVERADGDKPNMGLTTWKGKVVRKSDVTVAKNYLHEDEITDLNRIVVMFLDYAEDQARRRKQIFMNDWKQKLDDFLKFNERGVLDGCGKVTRQEADDMAAAQYDRFHRRRLEQADNRSEESTMKELEDAARKIDKKGTAKDRSKSEA